MLLRDLQSWESVEIILKQFKTLAETCRVRKSVEITLKQFKTTH